MNLPELPEGYYFTWRESLLGWPEVNLKKRNKRWFPTTVDTLIALPNSKDKNPSVEGLIEWGAEELYERWKMNRDREEQWKELRAGK